MFVVSIVKKRGIIYGVSEFDLTREKVCENSIISMIKLKTDMRYYSCVI